MKKLWNLICSRYFLSALVILIEFVLLLIVFILLYEHSLIMVILGYIFYFGVFLYIINKYKTPEFKLPWIILLLLLSVVGSYIFVILVGSEDTKKASIKFKKNKEKFKFNLNDNVDPQIKYITNATKLPSYDNSFVTYFEDGSLFYKSLLESLKKAKKYIFMEYFIVEEGVMWNSIHEILKEKVLEGVQVYVIYDDFGCMTTLNENYYKKLNKEGINCCVSNKFRPILSSIHNNRDHRKITVIDGIIGYTGGINIADEYINVKIKYGHWKDTAVKIEGEAVNNLIALFLETWNLQNKELNYNDFVNKEIINYNDGLVIPYGDGPEEFYEDNIGKNVYLNMINNSKEKLYITTPYLICDYEILNALCLASKRGVDVKIIVPHIPDKKIVFWMTQSNYEMLIKSGVSIYEYTPGFIHAKNFICDDKYATCGTINLDYRSLAHHFECGLFMYNCKCIKDMNIDFINTLNDSTLITLKKAKLKGFKKLIIEVLKVFSPLF